MQLSTALRTFLGRTDVERRIGPFVLVRPLGRGGQAPVWLAREVYGDTELRLAAVKLFSFAGEQALDAGWSRSTTSRNRAYVMEEAKALCRVEHPSIVRFYSMASDDERAVVGVAMEYLTGTSLEARIAERGALPIDEVLALGASVASALSAVHRAGLVHRDVKPANIVDSAGTHKLIDFGIAWEEPREPRIVPVLVDDLPLEISSDERSNIPGAVTFHERDDHTTGTPRSGPRLHTGTPGYVDPACLRRGDPATAASDVYALGVVLFECLTGRHPAAVAAGKGEGLRHQVLVGQERAPTLSSLVPDAPSGLEALIASMLDPEPANRPRSADWIAVELERIRGEASGVRRALPPEEVGPFRGLGRFEAGDRDVYFGRASEIAAGVELLRTNGLVTLIGLSGSGKSSLARAGVIPRVRDGALGRSLDGWDVATVVPGHDPRAAIVRALGELPDPPFAADAASLEPADVVAALGARARATSRGALLFVDQLEELVTLAEPDGAESRRWTVDLLVALGQAAVPGVRALATARRDLLDPLLAVQGLGRVLVRGTSLVEPMTDATWGDVLHQALAAYGYRLEDDALARELQEQLAGTAGAMPLVQFALTELWNKRDTTNRLVTRAGLRAIGGIAGSLERHAEATIEALNRAHPGAAARVRDVLVDLTTPQGTRATVALDRLGAGDPDRLRVVRALEEARLLVTGPDGATLAHDALLTQWDRLRRWLGEVREQRLLAAELERDAERWASDPEGVAPWRKRRLATAQDLASAGGVALTDGARRFLLAGRRAERRGRAILAAVSVVVASLGAASAVGYVRRVQADEAAAQERAAHEASRASLELAKRVELEKAQNELDGRQKTIDQLVSQLSKATDPSTIEDVQRRMKEEQARAHSAQQRIAAARPPAAPASSPPAAAPSPVGPKIQREDP